MANPDGHAQTLIASHPGNSNRLVHSLYATREREVSEDAARLVDALMSAPHVAPIDRLAAVEIASLVELIGRVDAALADGRVENGRGEVRRLVDQRARLSGKLQGWLDRFGATPAARADWASRLASATVADEVRRRLAEIEEGG